MDKKEVYQEKIDARLAEWQAKIDEMRAKARQEEAEAKEEYLKQIEELEQKRSETLQKLEKLKAQGDVAWDDLKEGVNGALSELESSFQKIKSRFQ
jgi:uncharacterized coiled-coil DUF342 family protein